MKSSLIVKINYKGAFYEIPFSQLNSLMDFREPTPKKFCNALCEYELQAVKSLLRIGFVFNREVEGIEGIYSVSQTNRGCFYESN